MAKTNRILIVVTNVSEYERVGYRTGLWLGELTHFWDVAEAAGYEMDIVSPAGGYIPIDPESLMFQELGHALGVEGKVHNRYQDRAFMGKLENTKKVADADPSDYDAIYLTGGHGVCFDFPKCAVLAERIAQFYESGKVVSAVCHGPSGLLEVKLSNEYLVTGKNVTGFSWNEEIKAGRDKAVPFNLEDELRNRGAHYTKSLLPFASHVVEENLLITGENPASAAPVAEAVVKRLRSSAPTAQEVVGVAT